MQKQQKHALIGVSVIIVDPSKKILLMKRAKGCKTYPDQWGFVGGFMEANETPEEACKRETQEEIGVKIEVLRFIGRYYNTPNPAKGLIISLPHYCKIVSGEPHPAQPEECSDVRWFTASEIRDMELAYDHKQMLKDEGLCL